MAKTALEGLDPLHIFLHGLGFHVAENALGKHVGGPNVQLAAQLAEPVMVLSAFTTELFLKCLICLETTKTPQGHHLFELFEQLSPATQAKIVHLWDTHIVPVRDPEWTFIESQPGIGRKIHRDLPGALAASSRAFEKIRYGYEPKNRENSDFNVSDMPRILHRLILEMKPEWANLGRDVKPVPGFVREQK